MFKSQKMVLITGLGLYVLYIIGFSMLFGPMDYSWAFIILAVMMGLGFYSFISDYYPQTEAQKMEKSPSDNARYIEDTPYFLASSGAILMLLISITPLMITVYVNQCGESHVSWILQALIFLGGYMLQFITLGIYKSCDSISISGDLWFSKWSVDSASSKATMAEVQEITSEISDILAGRPSKEIYAEARRIVQEVLADYLGESKMTGTTALSDLGADELDMVEITLKLDERMNSEYGYGLSDLDYYPKASDKMIGYIDLYSLDDDVFVMGAKLNALLPTVNDWYDLVAETIQYIRKYRK